MVSSTTTPFKVLWLMFTFLLNALIHWCKDKDFTLFHRYNNDLELEDAIHTAILTLKVCGLM